MNKDEKYGIVGVIGHGLIEMQEELLIASMKVDNVIYKTTGIPAHILDSYEDSLNDITEENVKNLLNDIAPPEIEPKAKSDSEEFLTRGQKREPKHQTHKRNYKFHR